MKDQLSHHTKSSQSHVGSSQARKRLPKKVGLVRSGVQTTARLKTGARKPGKSKGESEQRAHQLKANGSGAKKDYAADRQRAAHRKSSSVRQETKKLEQDVGKNGDAERRLKPTNRSNGSIHQLTPIWLDWSNATIAVNSMRMEELMRCRSPIDLMAVGSRFALRFWFDVWLPLLQAPNMANDRNARRPT
jgi:hypothetical protein